jgi:hypothetical protein
MFKFVSNRLSVKISLFVNIMLFIVMAAGTYVLIQKQSASLEAAVLDKVKIQSMVGAKTVGKLLEEAIDNGVFSVQDAFDTDYKKIGNFDPPKYHTKYDSYLDKSLLGIIDEFLVDKSIVFAVAVDKNGYLPTHNTPYQQPITNNVEKDRVGNRTKRIFNDAVGLKAAQNQEMGLIQVYHRDTGVTMWDISSPIFVKGKHWGGFRIGLSLEALDKVKKHLQVSLISIMAVVLVLSIIISFIAIDRALIVLKGLTDKAVSLSLGKNLEVPIPNTRNDEIGELEKVLERIRMSFTIAFNREKKKAEKPAAPGQNQQK